MSAWLVLGPIRLIHGGMEVDPRTSVDLVPLHEAFESRMSVTVVWDRPDMLLQSKQPLFVLSDVEGRFEIFSRNRVTARDGYFLRVTETPLEERDWLPKAVALHRKYALLLNNHRCHQTRCFPDMELEHKFTLAPVPDDLWAVAAAICHRLACGDLPGFAPEYGQEIQTWEHANHLFEVLEPDTERGYLSYIPTTDGRHLIKRKWFAQDAFARRESIFKGVDVKGSFAADARSRFPVQFRELPAFHRSRFDVQVESQRSGHVYGIFIDRSFLYDAPQMQLSQCEVEYLRANAVLPIRDSDVLSEMQAVAHWTESVVRGLGFGTKRGPYSKLSFLRDAVSALT